LHQIYLCLAWCGSGDNYGEIYWTKIDEKGTPGTFTRISDYLLSALYDDSDPRIAVDKEGNSYIVWLSFNVRSGQDFDQKVRWAKVDAQGNLSKAKEISTYLKSNRFDWNCRIAVDESGTSYVVWEGRDEMKKNHIFFTADLKKRSSSFFWLLMVVILIGMFFCFVFLFKRRMNIRARKENGN
jgi:hypothetical protein